MAAAILDAWETSNAILMTIAYHLSRSLAWATYVPSCGGYPSISGRVYS
jgi:hypothetical protein